MEPIQFYCCDAVEGLDALSPEFADCVVTSPPYNIGTRYHSYDDADSRDDYLFFTTMWAQAVARVLKPTGSLFLNISGKPTDPWVPFDVAASFRPVLQLQNVIHWVKSITVKEETYGHFKPINSDRFLNDCHEYLFHFTHTGSVKLDRTAIGAKYQDPSNLRRWINASRERLHCRGNCWFIPYPTRQAKLNHPATFPETLVDYCLRLHGLPPVDYRAEFQVVDPFVGIGTTALVAARLGLACVGFDIDQNYLTLAAARVEAELGLHCDLHAGCPDAHTV